MDPNKIAYLAEKSKISSSKFPLDIYYISERISGIENSGSESLKPIKVSDINYVGVERSMSTSHISICFNPENVIQ